MNNRHIIIMGFKHVGKTEVGRALAKRRGVPFYELDAWVEKAYEERFGRRLTCREIVSSEGELLFRDLERESLYKILHLASGVIDLGGGAIMTKPNQELIKGHHIIHVTAPEEVVFDRVSASKWPQILAGPQAPRQIFQELWQERKLVYESLAMVTITNDDLTEMAVEKIMEHLK